MSEAEPDASHDDEPDHDPPTPCADEPRPRRPRPPRPPPSAEQHPRSRKRRQREQLRDAKRDDKRARLSGTY